MAEDASAKVAFVTGASRGVGKAAAVSLAAAGFDVAVTARTVHEGDGADRAHDGTVRPLPGSIERTAELVEEQGRRALPVALDLSDPVAIGVAVTTVLERWGRIDVLVNNAIYTGIGAQMPVLETTMAHLQEELAVDVVAPLQLVKLVLPQMLGRGGGTVINVTSAAGYVEPLQMGSYGIGYAVGKAAMHKIAGILAVELGDRGIRAFNVHPGFILTERMQVHMADLVGLDVSKGAPPEVCGEVIAWAATSPDADALSGTNIESHQKCAELGLVPGWAPAGA
ncbi:MAG TPA: SDR family oxidoreductase [Acidimicrobiales bacterium]|nr:SDR family oxidoreductase [Acidimicrobiales bacterium]